MQIVAATSTGFGPAQLYPERRLRSATPEPSPSATNDHAGLGDFGHGGRGPVGRRDGKRRKHFSCTVEQFQLFRLLKPRGPDVIRIERDSGVLDLASHRIPACRAML